MTNCRTKVEVRDANMTRRGGELKVEQGINIRRVNGSVRISICRPFTRAEPVRTVLSNTLVLRGAHSLPPTNLDSQYDFLVFQ